MRRVDAAQGSLAWMEVSRERCVNRTGLLAIVRVLLPTEKMLKSGMVVPPFYNRHFLHEEEMPRRVKC